MSKWEIFSDANADDDRYKWRKINNISNHVIKPLPPPIASPLPSMYDLLLHASNSHLFQPQGTLILIIEFINLIILFYFYFFVLQ